jgi:laccase
MVFAMAGEWWEEDLTVVEWQLEGHYPNSYFSASTMNGKLGDLYNCSGN